MAILVGTASWTDKTLIESGAFYPPGCNTPEARLRYYASVFPVVEVDSSYYAMPSATNSALWAERTPKGFVFDLKAFRLFTGHQTEPKFFPKDLQPELPHSGRKNLYYKDVPPPIVEELWSRFFEALRVAGRRKGAGDGRRNGASRTGGKTRIRTVSRLRFFAVFGNCILRGIWHRFRGAVTVALEDESVGAVA